MNLCFSCINKYPSSFFFVQISPLADFLGGTSDTYPSTGRATSLTKAPPAPTHTAPTIPDAVAHAGLPEVGVQAAGLEARALVVPAQRVGVRTELPALIRVCQRAAVQLQPVRGLLGRRRTAPVTLPEAHVLLRTEQRGRQTSWTEKKGDVRRAGQNRRGRQTSWTE